MMNGMSLHPYPKGATTGCQISILKQQMRIVTGFPTGKSIAAHYAPEAMQHVREREFPDRRLRKKTPETDRVSFQAKCDELRLHAAEQERLNPAFFAIGRSDSLLVSSPLTWHVLF